MVEVETKLIGADIRPLLAGGITQDVLQGTMEQVRGRVVPTRSAPTLNIHLRVGRILDVQGAALDDALVHDVSATIHLGVLDEERRASSPDPAGVADLA